MIKPIGICIKRRWLTEIDSKPVHSWEGPCLIEFNLCHMVRVPRSFIPRKKNQGKNRRFIDKKFATFSAGTRKFLKFGEKSQILLLPEEGRWKIKRRAKWRKKSSRTKITWLTLLSAKRRPTPSMHTCRRPPSPVRKSWMGNSPPSSMPGSAPAPRAAARSIDSLMQ